MVPRARTRAAGTVGHSRVCQPSSPPAAAPTPFPGSAHPPRRLQGSARVQGVTLQCLPLATGWVIGVLVLPGSWSRHPQGEAWGEGAAGAWQAPWRWLKPAGGRWPGAPPDSGCRGGGRGGVAIPELKKKPGRVPGRGNFSLARNVRLNQSDTRGGPRRYWPRLRGRSKRDGGNQGAQQQLGCGCWGTGAG